MNNLSSNKRDQERADKLRSALATANALTQELETAGYDVNVDFDDGLLIVDISKTITVGL